MALFLGTPGAPPRQYNAEEEGQYRQGVQQVFRRIAALLGQGGESTVTVTAAYQMKTDNWLVRGDTTSAGFAITLPQAASVKGQVFNVKKISTDGNTLVLDGNGAETIDGAANLSWSTAYQSFTVISNGVSWDIL